MTVTTPIKPKVVIQNVNGKRFFIIEKGHFALGVLYSDHVRAMNKAYKIAVKSAEPSEYDELLTMLNESFPAVPNTTTNEETHPVPTKNNSLKPISSWFA